MTRFITLAVALIAVFSLAACSDDDVTGPNANDAGFTAVDGIDAELKPGPLTIAAIAEAEGFSLLLDAVGYIAETNPESGLVAGLLNDDQYTVFAPTNAAFEALVNAVADLLDPEILENEGPFAAIDDLLGDGTIEAVVAYHVTEGRRSSRSVLPRNKDRTIKTLLEGATFSVDKTGVITAVGSSAQIAPADVSASNGIIHVIDTVLLPIDLGL
jgi:transforming growth factor-beta-induced protein